MVRFECDLSPAAFKCGLSRIQVMRFCLASTLCRTGFIAAMIVAFLVASVGCAGSPAKLRKMSPDELMQVASEDLCYAYAFNKGQHKVAPDIDREVARRNADCSLQVEYQVDDCSALEIESTRPSATFFNVTEVDIRNSSSRPKRFRLMAPSGVYGKYQIVGPQSTVTIMFVADVGSEAISKVLQAAKGEVGSSWKVFQCYTAR